MGLWGMEDVLLILLMIFYIVIAHGNGEQMFSSVKRWLYPLTSCVFTRVQILEGTVKGTGRQQKVALIGDDRFMAEFCRQQFDGNPRVVESFRMLIALLLYRFSAGYRPASLTVFALPTVYFRLFPRTFDYRLSPELRHKIATHRGWDDIRSRFSPRIRQLTNELEKRTGLSSRISRDPVDFDFFYRRMFATFIPSRHGEGASVSSPESLKKIFRRGMLLFVQLDGKDVAGALCYRNGSDLVFKTLGILDANREFVRRGAQIGLYYFILKYASNHEVPAVDITVTSPFLNDGLFRHKTAWGSKLSGNAESRRPINLLLNNDPASAARLFESNPLVVAGGDRLQALMGDASIDTVTADRREKIQCLCRSLGISKAYFHTASAVVVIDTQLE